MKNNKYDSIIMVNLLCTIFVVFGMTASLLSQEQTRVGRFYNTVSQWYNTDLLSCASHCDLERTCVAFQHDPLNGGCATTDRYYSYPVTLERPTNYITWSKNSTWHEWREFSTTMAQGLFNYKAKWAFSFQPAAFC